MACSARLLVHTMVAAVVVKGVWPSSGMYDSIPEESETLLTTTAAITDSMAQQAINGFVTNQELIQICLENPHSR